MRIGNGRSVIFALAPWIAMVLVFAQPVPTSEVRTVGPNDTYVGQVFVVTVELESDDPATWIGAYGALLEWDASSCPYQWHEDGGGPTALSQPVVNTGHVGAGRLTFSAADPYGANGYLSTCMTFKPQIAWRYWNVIEAGDLEVARSVIRDYDMPLFDYLIASEGSFDAAVHGIFELLGFAKRYRRPPYHSLTNEQMQDLADFLEKRKFL